jgi:enediyne core biosynthesis thioesterase
MSKYTTRPRITFQDTNLVGNVYFLTFFRWQLECRDAWLSAQNPNHEKVPLASKSISVLQFSTRFEDSFGARLGDQIEVTLSEGESIPETLSLDFEIWRRCDRNSDRLATGSMICSEHGGDGSLGTIPSGPSYTYDTQLGPNGTVTTLDLLSWQGKCRELFLCDHAWETMQRVSERNLILQTTSANLCLHCQPPSNCNRLRTEMRLESLRCGQLLVRFDYRFEQPDGTARYFASGHQKMSSKRQVGAQIVPCPIPCDFLNALRLYTQAPSLFRKIDEVLEFSLAEQKEQHGPPSEAICVE